MLKQILGSINIADFSKNMVFRVINFQTSLCYGNPGKFLFNKPPKSIYHYGLFKTFAEIHVQNEHTTGFFETLFPKISQLDLFNFIRELKNKACFVLSTKRFFGLMTFMNCSRNLIWIRSIRFSMFLLARDFNKKVLTCKSLPWRIGSWVKGYQWWWCFYHDIRSIWNRKDFWLEAKIQFEEMVNKQLKYYDESGIIEIFSHLKNKLN